MPRPPLAHPLLAAALVAAGLLPGAIRATSYCVDTAAELQAALADAATNDLDDTILVEPGTYQAPPGGFVYQAEVDEANDLTLVGGSISLLTECSVPYPSATLTTLVGTAPDRVLRVFAPGNAGDVRIANLTLTGGAVNGNGGGLLVETSIAPVELERVIVRNNSASGAGGGIYANVYIVRVHGILVADNSAGAGVGGAYFANHSGVTEVELSTFAHNTGTPGGVEFGGSGHEMVDGTISWGNGPGVDFALSFNAGEANSVLYATRTGNFYSEAYGAIHDDPLFLAPVGAPGNYALRYDSPARDAAQGFSTTATRDVHGNRRPNGVMHDLGAVEVPWIFAADHEDGNLNEWNEP